MFLRAACHNLTSLIHPASLSVKKADRLRNPWEIKTDWKRFLLQIGKMDERAFGVKIRAILLPCHVAGCCLRIAAGPSFLTHMFNILYTYQFISSNEVESLITCERCTYEIPCRCVLVRVVWFGGWLMCLSPLCCFPSFVSCCCLDRHGLAGDRNKWVR